MDKIVGVAILVALIIGASGMAAAQYEHITLSPGFLPDPVTGSGLPGGPVDASDLGDTPSGSCRGYIDSSADHVLTLEERLSYLRVTVSSEYDSTLVIKFPDGRVLCNASAEGLSPVIEADDWPEGRYEVFVGVPEQGEYQPYRLTITEIRGAAARESRPHLAQGGSLSLAPGFLPDARVLAGRSGGSADTSGVATRAGEACVGRIPESPSYVVTLERDFSYIRLAVVRAEGDTTLVIEGPNGWLCDDDTLGFNPEVSGSLPAGVYKVYVGSADSGEHSYTLHITEFRP